jgi:hypothetical protein
MTLDEFKEGLRSADLEVRVYLVGKLMRQAKPDDVFTFVSPGRFGSCGLASSVFWVRNGNSGRGYSRPGNPVDTSGDKLTPLQWRILTAEPRGR